MSKLDERLEQAGAEVRQHMQRVPLPPIREGKVQRRRTATAFALGVVAIAAIATPVLWLRGDAGEDQGGAGTAPVETSAPSLSTVPSSTQPTTVTETSAPETTTTSEAGGAWISVGEPVSDDEFEALFLERPVPGTARRLAWTDGYDGRYTLGLFAARMGGEAYEEYGYCLFDYASTSGGGRSEFGGAICVRTAERFAELLAFGVGGGGRCVEPVAHMWDVWGVPESADQVVFELSDGTRLTGQNVNGVAQVATGRDVAVDSITFEGVTAEQLAEIERLTTANHQTCAELNNPDLPG